MSSFIPFSTVGVKKGNVLLLHYENTTILCTLTTMRTTRNYKSYYRKLQIVLHKTTDCTTQNYKSCYKYLDT